MLGWHDQRPLAQLLPAKEAKAFSRHFSFTTVEDLLQHFPRGYAAHGTGLAAEAAEEGDIITCVGTIVDTHEHPDRNGYSIYSVVISDGFTRSTATFFRATWIKKVLTHGSQGIFTGKLKFFRNTPQLQHPDFFLFPEKGKKATGTGGMQALSTTGELDDITDILVAMSYLPVYPAKKAIPTWRILGAVHNILTHTPHIEDPLHEFAPHDLPSFDQALRGIHEPDEHGPQPYITRIKYDEALTLALVMALRRADTQRRHAYPMPPTNDGLRAHMLCHLPFELTEGQHNVLTEISADLAQPTPMSRLLQGEVGSGKTIVSLLAMLQVIDDGKQCVLLAPTEVLAAQHATSITQQLTNAGININVTLLTGSLPTEQRRKALLNIISGDANLIIGTHALIQEGIEFFDLALCVIDEQHRFGVEQRDHLRNQGRDTNTPHVLVMTATPIPRSIAMTAFGDLSVSTLKQLPGGRRPIHSYVIDHQHTTWTTRMWERIREEIDKGHQIYIVCPKIKDSGGVEETTHQLTTGILANYRIAMLHGAMHPEDKDTTMKAFAAGTIDVLVATTVIEVGIDVPNATVMLIRESENFGVSQLHQLRGRVGRGGNESICFFHTTAQPTTPAHNRVTAVAATTDGFELAEIDLTYRHEGNILGTQQSGHTNRIISFIHDKDLIERANNDATHIVTHNPQLARHLVADIDDTTQTYIDKS
ncbi:ATP-dependent DNA helicase [Corynebacterium diphtheriae HC01]|uniref:ATP-dependent DNA helicase RecG n=1 Tax=Corynebacterium diphtheriae TaxID=1717 RepID=UPI000245B501|nr:ATP-dependent DNA helicase RecG [Corynebacterium diphtheriae]AEX44112.1 ATP-dependent DNA helicase [Corynebacterium diphtheriae 241]AEX74298.1 ATP-dependent DNA helicase [Corynebacterium diphtheriae HC01]